MGPTTFIRLVNEYGGVKEALEALPNIARLSGVQNYEPAPLDQIEKEFAEGERLGLQPIFLGSQAYPLLLMETPDPPPMLWVKGKSALLGRTAIGVIGARNASAMGQRQTKMLTKDLASLRISVVSGLARGIDAVAHEAALPTGTIACMAGGLAQCYPKENQALFDQIAETGLLISEHPPWINPQARHFPQRNRIIAGLCKALVVIEGAARSGSLITARIAGELGRDVMAVPGNPMDPRAAGCNMLIREGATLIRSAADIFEDIELPEQMEMFAEPAAPPPRLHQKISRFFMERLGPNNTDSDALIRAEGADTATALRRIGEAEINGDVLRSASGRIAKSSD